MLDVFPHILEGIHDELFVHVGLQLRKYEKYCSVEIIENIPQTGDRVSIASACREKKNELTSNSEMK